MADVYELLSLLDGRVASLNSKNLWPSFVVTVCTQQRTANSCPTTVENERAAQLVVYRHYCRSSIFSRFITPRVHAQKGQSNQSRCVSVVVIIVVVVVVGTKITKSQDLGICAHRQISVKTGLCTLRIAEHASQALQIVYFLFSMPVVYRLHPPCSILVHNYNSGKQVKVI